jgi:bifunctional UDP-N-acetylglucosamine pyrophosphorylase/glucosamine-1-phosphate N-acetyltransferase
MTPHPDTAPERDRADATGIVLAAGHGTRMRSRLPKVLHPVCGVPLVAHLLRALAGSGASRAIVVTGHGGDAVEGACCAEAAGLELRFVRQDPPRGTGDALRCALAAATVEDRTLLVVNGDLPLLRGETLRELLLAHRGARAAMSILSQVRDEPRGYGRLVRGEGGRVLRIVEDRDASPEERRIREVNGGIYAIEAAALRPALAVWCRREEERLGRGAPGPAEIYLPPVIEPIAAAGGRVIDHPLAPERGEELAQVNDRRELAVAADRLRHRIIAEHQLAGVTVVDPGQTWIECDVAIGADTTIHPGCVIRRGVRIGEGCEIGPFAHLREGTALGPDVQIGNFVEVKKTTVGRGSRAKHLTYLGDGEIGDRVNIGAGTVLANFDGVRKSETRIEDGAFIGSGTIIVAPARIGAGARTGAGAVVTRGQDIPPGETVVGVPARPLGGRPGRGEDPPRGG